MGLLLLAQAPSAPVGMAGVLLVSGVAWTITRCVSVIWVNRQTRSDVRATVQYQDGRTSVMETAVKVASLY